MKIYPLLFPLLALFCISGQVFSQEIAAENISIACGNHYFSFTGTSQPPLIVRGKWCGDSYFYVPVNLGDTLLEPAYLGEQLFSGNAIANDSVGNTLAKYNFKDGFLEEIIEYMGKHTLRYHLHFSQGIPHGSHQSYNWEGELSMEKTYKNGVLDGPFYWRRDRTDYGLPPCVETGIYHMGILELTSEPCKWDE